METKIYVDGRITDEASAVVPAMDRGFLYGDGVYEVFPIVNGRGVDREAHMQRLQRSAAKIRLSVPENVDAAIDATVAAAGPGDAYVRVMVTRGSGDFGLDPALADTPRVVVIVRALSRPAAHLYQDGVAVRVVDVERTSPRALDPAIKSGNYLNNILALDRARRAGAVEAILCDAQGRVAEGSTSNVWAVRGGRLETPPLEIGLLPGITRWRLFQLAGELGLTAVEAVLTADDLRGADELFLSSSIRGVLPISRIDDRALPVGPVTRRLVERYEAFLRGA